MFQLSSLGYYSRISLLLLGMLCSQALWAQTPISGSVNTYTAVTSTANIGSNALSVASAAGFGIGDLVLIIQMQGASINTTNSSSFGDVTAYNGAGHYELATICNIAGNELTFEHSLLNTDYVTSGKVQVIRVPQYTQATVTGTLTASPWDGNTGGVLILSVAGKLRLDAPINLDGRGFRGGGYENSDNNTCSWTNTRSNYAYNNADLGAAKGEGIAAAIPGMEYGKGAQANGGGGGNDHNAGGGGGSNAGTAGLGGENDEPGFFNCKGRHPGVGGKNVLTSGRIFLGGGGGAGHGNNIVAGQEGPGANGGGILILIADTLEVGASNQITANGDDAIRSTYDGAGGGGSGGSMHLWVNTYVGTPGMQVTGGDGGDADNDNGNRCYGPGGGGSGGLSRFFPAPPGAVVLRNGGTAGQTIRSSNGCSGSTNGATDGGLGLSQTAAIPQSTVPSPFCQPLPVQWKEIALLNAVLSWTTAHEPEGSWFAIERSRNARDWQELSRVPAKADPLRLNTYALPVSSLGELTYFRVVLHDLQGEVFPSAVVTLHDEASFEVRLFPNPLNGGDTPSLELYLPEAGEITLSLTDLFGKEVRKAMHTLPAGSSRLSFPGPPLAPGVYLLRVNCQGLEYLQRLLVVQ